MLILETERTLQDDLKNKKEDIIIFLKTHWMLSGLFGNSSKVTTIKNYQLYQ